MKNCLLPALMFLTLIAGTPAEANTITFNTSDSRLDGVTDNQGFWSSTVSNNGLVKDNYFTAELVPAACVLGRADALMPAEHGRPRRHHDECGPSLLDRGSADVNRARRTRE